MSSIQPRQYLKLWACGVEYTKLEQFQISCVTSNLCYKLYQKFQLRKHLRWTRGFCDYPCCSFFSCIFFPANYFSSSSRLVRYRDKCMESSKHDWTLSSTATFLQFFFLKSFFLVPKVSNSWLFQKRCFMKLFDIEFPYKHCYFKPVCLLVKVASTTVIRTIIMTISIIILLLLLIIVIIILWRVNFYRAPWEGMADGSYKRKNHQKNKNHSEQINAKIEKGRLLTLRISTLQMSFEMTSHSPLWQAIISPAIDVLASWSLLFTGF